MQTMPHDSILQHNMSKTTLGRRWAQSRMQKRMQKTTQENNKDKIRSRVTIMDKIIYNVKTISKTEIS